MTWVSVLEPLGHGPTFELASSLPHLRLWPGRSDLAGTLRGRIYTWPLGRTSFRVTRILAWQLASSRKSFPKEAGCRAGHGLTRPPKSQGILGERTDALSLWEACQSVCGECSQFPRATVVTFDKIAVNAEIANTEQLFPGKHGVRFLGAGGHSISIN